MAEYCYFVHTKSIGMVKIGKSCSPNIRARKFLATKEDYIIGWTDTVTEWKTHEIFNKYRVKPKAKFDGYTEFFSDRILQTKEFEKIKEKLHKEIVPPDLAYLREHGKNYIELNIELNKQKLKGLTEHIRMLQEEVIPIKRFRANAIKYKEVSRERLQFINNLNLKKFAKLYKKYEYFRKIIDSLEVEYLNFYFYLINKELFEKYIKTEYMSFGKVFEEYLTTPEPLTPYHYNNLLYNLNYLLEKNFKTIVKNFAIIDQQIFIYERDLKEKWRKTT